jgi:hypothetical protein
MLPGAEKKEPGTTYPSNDPGGRSSASPFSHLRRNEWVIAPTLADCERRRYPRSPRKAAWPTNRPYSVNEGDPSQPGCTVCRFTRPFGRNRRENLPREPNRARITPRASDAWLRTAYVVKKKALRSSARLNLET